jgi:hypothetical protein
VSDAAIDNVARIFVLSMMRGVVLLVTGGSEHERRVAS